LKIWTIGLVAFLLPLLAVSTVNAAHPMTGSGQLTTTSSTVISQRTFDHGDLVLLVVNLTLSFTGNLSGTGWVVLIGLNHTETGIIPFYGVAHFTGTLNAMSGTLLMSITGVNNGTYVRAHFDLQAGTGQLAGVRGQGSFEGNVGTPASYTLRWTVQTHHGHENEHQVRERD
jgi:hypothetical protein